MKKAVKFLLENAEAGLFADPGTRKTSITLASIKMRKKLGLARKTLVIAPLNVAIDTWPDELSKWKDFNGLTWTLLHGPEKNERLKLDRDIYLINPDGLAWLADVAKSKTPTGKRRVGVDMKRWKKLGFDTLVIDELTAFKNTTSDRYKMMKLLAPTFKYRIGLTGSPVANGLLQLFGQMMMLDLGKSLGKFVTYYRAKYFELWTAPDEDVPRYILKPGADEEIYKAIAPRVLRLAAEDYMELPEVQDNPLKFELPRDARRAYDLMEEALIAQITGKTVTAANAVSAMSKCAQIASGGIYYDPAVEGLLKVKQTKREWLPLHDVKTDLLEDLINELQGSPIFVAYEFHHDLERLRARFGKDIPNLGSDVTHDAKRKLIERWNNNELPYLFAHPKSAAHGLNLQKGMAHHVAWYTPTYDYELYDQFIRRLKRSGNTAQRVFNHLLIAKNTVDEIKYAAVRRKAKGQQALFDGLKELAKKR